MTPAETLAAARNNPVGPYVTPRPEWLEGWCGPVEYLDHEAAENGDTEEPTWRPAIVNALGMVWYEDEDCGWRPVDRDDPGLRLDLRRPECRDLLVRRGCPAWARDCAPAVWAWAGGVEVRELLDPWVQPPWSDGFVHLRSRHGAEPTVNAGAVVDDRCDPGDEPGWFLQPRGGVFRRTALTSGPETGDIGRACADLAALRAGCILTESDGWYVPLVGGGVGWWPREVSGG